LEQSLKYASKEVTNWQQLLGDTAPGREIPSRRRLRRMLSRNGSMSCMTQLQFKQTIDTKGGFSREPELSSVAENGDR